MHTRRVFVSRLFGLAIGMLPLQVFGESDAPVQIHAEGDAIGWSRERLQRPGVSVALAADAHSSAPAEAEDRLLNSFADALRANGIAVVASGTPAAIRIEIAPYVYSGNTDARRVRLTELASLQAEPDAAARASTPGREVDGLQIAAGVVGAVLGVIPPWQAASMVSSGVRIGKRAGQTDTTSLADSNKRPDARAAAEGDRPGVSKLTTELHIRDGAADYRRMVSASAAGDASPVSLERLTAACWRAIAEQMVAP